MRIAITNALLSVIAVLLAAIALRPLFLPAPVFSQDSPPTPIVLNSLILDYDSTKPMAVTSEGPFLLDPATGKIWGYPMWGPKAFKDPILFGTYQGPGMPILRPTEPAGSPTEIRSWPLNKQ
jgi:hypothetical protein